ncbi:P-loop containing nucleoside triphosphate hydrolase protein, partial [Conidiobolus coronatus NRRL 28638]
SRVALHVNYIPKKLVGRESEFSQITKLLTKGLTQNNSLCVYISGVPGTGKTATVRSAIKELQQKRKAPLKFLELNGMKLSEPSQAYVELWKLISGKEVTPKHALDLLNAHFSDKTLKKEKILVIMDELDVLMTRKQDVIYHFFDWPYKFNSNLIVVAIANTMDLPERLLHHKVSSRLGSARINFAPYDHNQLYEIVRDRLGNCLWFTPDAIEICSRKVAAVSGDARRALDICRNAVEVFELEIKDKLDNNQALDAEITTATINKVYKAMYDNPTVKFIQSFSLNLKLILVSLLHLIKRTGITEVSVEQLISK